MWWTEENPDNQCMGILTFYPEEGIYLDLLGDLSDSPIGSRSAETFDKIFGVNEDGDHITLLNCTRNSASGLTEIQSSTYICSYLMEGAIFQNGNPSFNKIDISFYGMNWWVGGPTPRLTQESIKGLIETEDYNKIALEYEMPDPLSAWQDGTNIKLETNFSTDTKRYKSAKIEINNLFTIDPRRCFVPFMEYFDHISKLERFVTLGIGQPTSPKEITGYVGNSRVNRQKVQIFYQVSGTLHEDVSEHPNRMLFRGADIYSDFGSIIPMWYSKSEELEEIFNMYFGVVFQQNAYPENKLMNLCHGLESYHRKRFMDTYISNSEYDDIYNDLMNLINGNPSDVYSDLDSSDENIRDKHDMPSSFVQSLKDGTIKHANKKSLRRRQELIRAVKPIMADLPYSIVGKHEDVADTRNYFAHRTQELKRKATLGAGLSRLNWGIQQLIEACLLLEIGIGPDHIENRLHSKYSAKSITTS